jgi:hypothetical protein
LNKQKNEAKELAAKIAQLRIDIAPQSESEITVMRFKGDSGKTFPLTWSTEDSGNKNQGILTVATLKLGRREFKGYGFNRPDSIDQLEKELLGIGVTVKAREFA